MAARFLLVLTLIIAPSPGLHAETVIVQDGQPAAEIVIAEKPTRLVKIAAEELQSHVEKISGARLPIASTPGEGTHVFVGRSPQTDALKITDEGLEHGAFRIVSKLGVIVLLGRDADFVPPEPHARHNGDIPRATAEWDKLTGAQWGFPHTQIYKSRHPKLGVWEQDERGSFHAVFELLRRFGVRWFLPGEVGEVVPKRTTLSVPEGNETIRPDFALRYPYQYFQRFGMASVGETMWQLRLGLSQAPEVIGLSDLGHGTRTVHERKEVRDAHPEWFALFNGKQETEGSFGSGKPCLSSKGLFDENVRFVRAMFDVYREPMVSVMPEDGYVSLCQCELCNTRGTPERGWNGQISDYVWDYVNRVGVEVMKTHPDRRILCLAYGAYQSPPRTIEKLSPNVVVSMTQSRAAFNDPVERKLHEELREAWRANSSNPLLIWDYYLGARPGHTYEFLPMFFTRQIAADLKSLKGISYGDFIEVHREADGIRTLAANHLNLYVSSRYWWDARQPLEPLLKDYCEKFYGPAANEMRAFLDFSESNWNQMRKQPEKIDEAFSLLFQAQAKAPADSIYAKRIGLIADYIGPMKQLREQLARKREDVPHIQILTAPDKPIVVDGRLDEEVWQRPGGWGFAELETGRTPNQGTSFKAAWQKDSLILGITCVERDMARLAKATRERDNAGIWDGDVVELLLETQVRSYYQIAIGPGGGVTDLDRTDGKLNTLWNSGVEVATQREKNQWTIELRLPLADEQQSVLNPLDGVAGRAPSTTHPWHFNLCRQRVGAHGVELTALSPTGADHFHATDRFAILNLKAGGPNQDNPSLNPARREGYVLQRADAIELAKHGKHEDSLVAFRRLAEGKRTDLQQADALNLAAECALKLKRFDEAAALAKAIRLAPYSKLTQMRVLDAVSGAGSDPASRSPHRRQDFGRTATTAVHWSAGMRARSCLACPGRPPGRPPRFLFGAGLACGCSALGGSDELRGDLFNRASNSAIFASRMRIMACASGGCRAIISSVTSGSCDMLLMSPKLPPRKRSIPEGRLEWGVNGYKADSCPKLWLRRCCRAEASSNSGVPRCEDLHGHDGSRSNGSMR